MAEGEFSGPLLIEHDVSNALNFAVSGDDHDRQRQAFLEYRVDDNEAFYRTLHQQTRILLDQIGLAAMSSGHIEIAFFDQEFRNARQDLGCVTVAQLRFKDSDSEGVPFAERTR